MRVTLWKQLLVTSENKFEVSQFQAECILPQDYWDVESQIERTIPIMLQ